MTSHPQKPQAELLRRVLHFCEATDTRPETFGRLALNDARLVKSMKQGRELRYKTRQKVDQYMTRELSAIQRRLTKASAIVTQRAATE